LKQYPHNAWSLRGLSQAMRASGNSKEANSTERRFKKAWAKADVEMSASCLCIK
jgi:hypothetical protein